MSRSVLLAVCLVPCVALSACSKSPEASDSPAPKGEAKADEGAARADGGEVAKGDDGVDAAKGDDGEHAPAATATARVGQPAPDFSLTDLDGNAHSLAAYEGKVVVLEWFNPQCPFVEYAHTKGPLQDLARRQVADGVVWLAINSGGPGRQGHGEEANRMGVETFGMEHPVLLDESGAVGHQYGAVKTPHMFVVNAEGTLVYAGGVDNAPFGEVDGGGEPINYVLGALTDLAAGNPVGTPSAKPYGCTVKYGDS